MEAYGTRKRHDRQFKLDALRMITEQGRSMASVCWELGVGPSQFGLWKREFSEQAEHAFPGGGPTSDENKELENLRKELERVNYGRRYGATALQSTCS